MGYKRKNIRVFERINNDVLSLFNSWGVKLHIGDETSKGKIVRFEEDKVHKDDIYVHLEGDNIVFKKFHVDSFTKEQVDFKLMGKIMARKRLLILR